MNLTTNPTDTAKSIAKPFEGYSSKVYKCPAGYPTIGWGHRCAKDHPEITKEAGEAYLTDDMGEAMAGVLRHCPLLVAYPGILAAVTDFVFNLGIGRLQASTLRRRINQQDWTEATNELNKWVFGGGKKLPGLVLRRAVEARLIKP